MGKSDSEQTPLLGRSNSITRQDVEQSLEENDDIGATGLNAEFTDLRRKSSASQFYSSDVPESYHHGDSEDAEANEEDKSPYMDGIARTRFWIIFLCLNVGLFVACFDATLMASSHPVITSYFHASNSASWLSTTFLLTSTAFQPLFGRVSDTLGRRPLYVFALLMFAGTTGWCALSPTISSFIAARAFCGLGAGGTMAMGAIITNDLVKIEHRGTYQAVINLFFGLGNACGAAFGGYLCDTLGWRWTFGVQIPPLVTILIVSAIFIPPTLGPNLAKSSHKSALEILRGFDLLGSLLLSSSVAFLILGLNLGGNVLPWKHPLIIASLILSVVAGGVLVWVESRHVMPVLPLSMIWSRPRGHIVFSNFFALLGFNAILFNIPLYFQAVKFDTPSMSGFRISAPSLSTCFFGIGSGIYMTRTGHMNGLIYSGAIVMVIGGVLVTAMWDDIPLWVATAFICPASIGQGLNFPASTIGVLAATDQKDQAVMSSSLTLFRSLGIVMGVALSSLILQNTLSAYLDQLVTGKDKQEIISRVRSAVRAIQDLDPKRKAQVVLAYRYSLTWTFALSIVAFVIVCILTCFIHLPNLKDKKQKSKKSTPTEHTA